MIPTLGLYYEAHCDESPDGWHHPALVDSSYSVLCRHCSDRIALRQHCFQAVLPFVIEENPY